jgi:hypothetical protein
MMKLERNDTKTKRSNLQDNIGDISALPDPQFRLEEA